MTHFMRFAYADPPYLGCCGLYNHDHGSLLHADWRDDLHGLCWDDVNTHRLLIDHMDAHFPDGWALSASSPSLRHVLPLCPPNTRVAAWCKSFGAFKRGVRPAYMWEPVLFRGGRNPSNGHAHPPPLKNGKQTTPKDFVLCPITLKKGLTGAKPEKVCAWILDLLNVQIGDEVVDLFPGTGVMSRVVDIQLVSGVLPRRKHVATP